MISHYATGISKPRFDWWLEESFEVCCLLGMMIPTSFGQTLLSLHAPRIARLQPEDLLKIFFFLFIWLSFGQPKWAVLFFQEQPPLGFNLWVWERCIVCLAKEREWNPHRLRLAEFWPTSRAHPRKDSCPWTNLRDTMAVGKQSSWRAKPRRRRRPGLFANAFFWPPIVTDNHLERILEKKILNITVFFFFLRSKPCT